MRSQNNWQKTEINDKSNFSTFGLGIAGTGMIYLGLSLLSSSIKIPFIVWFIGLPLTVFATGVEYLSNRILLIRLSQATSFFVIAITYGLLLWQSLAHDSSLFSQSVIGLIILCIIVGAYLLCERFHKYYVANSMPHGSIGKLNQHTGMVEPNYMLVKDQEQFAQYKNRWGNATYLAPLFSGLAFLIIRIHPESGTTILLSFGAIIFFFFGILGAISSSLLISSISNWEQNHKMKIRLQRG